MVEIIAEDDGGDPRQAALMLLRRTMLAAYHSFLAAEGPCRRVYGHDTFGLMIQLGHTRKAVIHQVKGFSQFLFNDTVIHRITPFAQYYKKFDF